MRIITSPKGKSMLASFRTQMLRLRNHCSTTYWTHNRVLILLKNLQSWQSQFHKQPVVENDNNLFLIKSTHPQRFKERQKMMISDNRQRAVYQRHVKDRQCYSRVSNLISYGSQSGDLCATPQDLSFHTNETQSAFIAHAAFEGS